MRLNRLSELIHSSAQHKADVTHATVEVYFQEIYDDENEPDAYEVIPGTAFRVARRVDRQSHSKYILNGYESTFKDVCELLQSKGIDLEHNRFLILQGEVEQISLMKPIAQNANETGLLEYLEEIIGSNKYHERIAAATTTIEEKNDERIERVNRVKASQAELAGLESEKDAAVAYVKKERQYMLMENMLFFVSLDENVKAYNDTLEQIIQLRDQLKLKKEAQKAKFLENQNLVTRIQQIQTQEEEAKKKQSELKQSFTVLE